MFEKKYIANNTRRFKRMRAGYLVKYQIAGSNEEPFVSNLKDISAGGCRFWADQFLPEGVLLKVSIWVPPIERKIQALARLIRVRRSPQSPVYYLSASFVEVPTADQAAMNEFIEEISQAPGARQLVDDFIAVKRGVREDIRG